MQCRLPSAKDKRKGKNILSLVFNSAGVKYENLKFVNRKSTYGGWDFFPLRRHYSSGSLQCLTVYFAFRFNLATLVQYVGTNANYLVDRWKCNIQNYRHYDIQLIELLEKCDDAGMDVRINS